MDRNMVSKYFKSIVAVTALLGGMAFTSLQAQSVFPVKKETHTQELNLQGKIKTVTDYIYREENPQPKLLESSKPNYDAFKQYEFNPQGNLTTYKMGDSHITSLEVFYVYDAKGQLVEEKGSIFRGGEQLIRHQYDKKGNRNQSFWYGNDEELQKKYTATFDKKHKRLTTQAWNLEDQKEELEKYEFENDRLSKKLYFAVPDSLSFYETYEYNSAGDLTAQTRWDAEGKEIRSEKFTYEYDSEGNWIQQKTYENGRFRQLVKREILYIGQEPPRKPIQGLKKLR